MDDEYENYNNQIIIDSLLSLYTSSNGIDWIYQEGYIGTNIPLNKWYGISFDENKYLQINLSTNNLQGIICEDFGNLGVKLISLNLKNNSLVGTLPDSFKELVSLVELNLSANQLEGPFPEVIQYLANLETLNLGSNKFYGEIPSFLENLKSLKCLDLHENEFHGLIPIEICKMISLTAIDLSSNKLNGPISSEFGNLVNLTYYLRLQGNQLEGQIPPELCQLNLLIHLDLSYNHLTGEIPETLGQMIALKSFFVEGNQLTGNIPQSLSQLENLLEIRLYNNKLTRESVSQFSNIHVDVKSIFFSLSELYQKTTGSEWFNSNEWLLEEPNTISDYRKWYGIEYDDPSGALLINLQHNNLNGILPDQISNLKCLLYLNLSNNKLRGSIPDTIWSLKKLKHLDLSRNQFSGYISEDIVNLDLEYLDLSKNQLIEKCVVNSTTNDILHIKFWKKLHEELQDDNKLKYFNPLEYNHPPVDYGLRYPCMWVCHHKTLSYSYRPLGRFHHNKNQIIEFIKRLLKCQNIHILKMLLQLYRGCHRAARIKSTDRTELLECAQLFGNMITKIFACDSFDNDNVALLFLRNNSNFQGDIVWMYYWVSADIISKNEFLEQCLTCHFKKVFVCPQVSSRINFLFWGHSIFSNLYGQEEFTIYPTFLMLSSMRSHPIAMYVLEGFSRIILLGFLFQVLVDNNNSSEMCINQNNNNNDNGNEGNEGSSIILVLLVLSGILYEIGQIYESIESKNHIKYYFNSVWNITDITIYSLLLIWVGTYLNCTHLIAGKVALGLAAIPTSLSLLRYLSLQQKFGFAISFYGLFRIGDSFSSYGNTFLTLFNAALGSVDFTTFENPSNSVNHVGQFVMVIYVCIVTLIILNLLIARMASTYDEIQIESREHWSFSKAEITTEYILYYERHPLCMLPPPLNIVPTLLIPLHYYNFRTLKFKKGTNIISISGTASNILLWLIGLIPRLIIMSFSLLIENLYEIKHSFHDQAIIAANKLLQHSLLDIAIFLFNLLLLSPIIITFILLGLLLFIFCIAPTYFTLFEHTILFTYSNKNIITEVVYNHQQNKQNGGGKYLIMNGRTMIEQSPIRMMPRIVSLREKINNNKDSKDNNNNNNTNNTRMKNLNGSSTNLNNNNNNNNIHNYHHNNSSKTFFHNSYNTLHINNNNYNSSSNNSSSILRTESIRPHRTISITSLPDPESVLYRPRDELFRGKYRYQEDNMLNVTESDGIYFTDEDISQILSEYENKDDERYSEMKNQISNLSNEIENLKRIIILQNKQNLHN